MPTVFANGLSIIHKGDGLVHTCAIPDVCKTPTPAGPVPIPYVNIATDSMLAKGTKKVKIEGNPAGNAGSNLSVSSGDEPGTVGGLVSSKFKGKMTWGMSSLDVKLEGKGAVRFLDVTQHNGNTFNSAFITMGGPNTGFAYGDDQDCPICHEGPEAHRVHETNVAVGLIDQLFAALDAQLDAGGPVNSQRALAAKVLQARADRQVIYAEYDPRIDTATANERTAKAETAAALVTLQSTQGDRRVVGAAHKAKQLAYAARQTEVKALRAEREAATQEYSATIAATNITLDGMRNVLHKDTSTTTYTKGYMLGVLICLCNTKNICAVSGAPTVGFRDAAGNVAGLDHVEGFSMSARQKARVAALHRTWACAAPQLIEHGRAAPHEVRTMSEKWYSPHFLNLISPVHVNFRREVNIKTIDNDILKFKINLITHETESFAHGETVPSCETCQELAPEMLCNKKDDCT